MLLEISQAEKQLGKGIIIIIFLFRFVFWIRLIIGVVFSPEERKKALPLKGLLLVALGPISTSSVLSNNPSPPPFHTNSQPFSFTWRFTLSTVQSATLINWIKRKAIIEYIARDTSHYQSLYIYGIYARNWRPLINITYILKHWSPTRDTFQLEILSNFFLVKV